MPRRTGNIRYTSGGYRVQVTVVDADGKKTKKSSYRAGPEGVAGYREAEARLAELVAKYVTGGQVAPDADPGTVGELCERWLRHRSLALQPKTLDAYRAAVTRALPYIGDRPAAEVTGPEIDDVYRSLVACRRRPAQSVTSSPATRPETRSGRSRRRPV